MVNLVNLTPYLLPRGVEVIIETVLLALLLPVRLMLIRHALAAHTTRCLLGSTCGPSIGPSLLLLTATVCAVFVARLARKSRLPTAKAMWPLVLLM